MEHENVCVVAFGENLKGRKGMSFASSCLALCVPFGMWLFWLEIYLASENEGHSDPDDLGSAIPTLDATI